MKHFKIKITLAALFILANAVFCCVMLLYSPARSSDYTGIIQLLEKRGITVSEDAFDGISQTFLTDAVLENSISDHEKLARAILGDSANALPSAANIFMLNNKNVVFDGNSFHFENTENRDEYRFRGATDDNADSVAADVAEMIGIDITDCIIETSEDGDTVTYTVTKMADKKPVFNDSFTVVIGDDYLKSLDGIWFARLDGGDAKETKSIENALVAFANMPDVPRPATIVSLTTGYRIADTSKQSSRLIPVCRITLDGGGVYYADM